MLILVILFDHNNIKVTTLDISKTRVWQLTFNG